MGYPMTYKRVINRNGLADGDYDTPPQRAPFWHFNNKPEVLIHMLPEISKKIDTTLNAYANLCGDLRRFERDTLDEAPFGPVARIAARTGISPDVVAGVLKEFLND